jgi:putative hydrolase of the HAD superfamily
LGVAAGYGAELVDAAMAVFNALRNNVEVFPEVRPALSSLRQNYRVIAVTNGNANLDTIGIRDLFHGVVSAASVGAAKPARQIFDVAVEAGGARSHETLHVGDHPEVDVVGASNAGLKSVWVNRGGQDWPDHLQRPDGIVRDIGGLLTLLGVAPR